MKKILTFSGSNNPQSINQQLVTYASTNLNECCSTLITLCDFSLDLYNPTIEEKSGIPESAFKLRSYIEIHDAYIISVNEHNRSVSAFFKNTMDWLSRAGDDYNVFQGKPILLLGTSPGIGGAKNAINHATSIFNGLGGAVVSTFPLPQFHKNVVIDDLGFNIVNEKIRIEFLNCISSFEAEYVENYPPQI